MELEKISIIIPCYNVEQWIGRCLESLIKQTYAREYIEIICIDDASTDQTYQELLKWEQKYPENFLIIHCDENIRQGAARNLGLEYASGEWITFIDADDWVEIDYLEILYREAYENNCDIVSCGVLRDCSKDLCFVSERSQTKKLWILDDFVEQRLFFHLKALEYSVGGKFMKKEFLTDNRISFPEGITYEDTYWSVLLHYYAKRASVIDSKLYHYYLNDKSTVLTTGSLHHLDALTGIISLWEELKRRGIYQEYKDELEFEFLFSCYFVMMKVAVFRYEKPEYSIYRLARSITLEKVPDFRNNMYAKIEGFSEYNNMQLLALEEEYSRTEFMKLAEKMRRDAI